MAANRPFLCLAVFFVLCKCSSIHNNAPCQPSTRNNGYVKFICRHMCSDARLLSSTRTSLDQNKWQNYIKSLGSCDRVNQSFLRPEDLEKVKAVCTNRGGRVYKGNLCISIQPFDFVKVTLMENTCNVQRVVREKKHLILACDMLGNQCLPVHFQRNPNALEPGNNAKPCQRPLTSHMSGYNL